MSRWLKPLGVGGWHLRAEEGGERLCALLAFPRGLKPRSFWVTWWQAPAVSKLGFLTGL